MLEKTKNYINLCIQNDIKEYPSLHVLEELEEKFLLNPEENEIRFFVLLNFLYGNDRGGGSRRNF